MTSLPEPRTRLHPQLEKDCHYLGKFDLCHLLVMNDSNYPWFILVPDVADVTEVYQLFQTDQEQLMRESSLVSRMLVSAFNVDKVNIAALGNIVPQLHIHHVGRFSTDPAWPAPVWGHGKAMPYTKEGLADMKKVVKTFMACAGCEVVQD